MHLCSLLKQRINYKRFLSMMHQKCFEYNFMCSGGKWDLNFGKYAIIFLNTPITVPPEVIQKLWDGACVRSLVDGGADRWLSFLKRHKLTVKSMMPDLLTGDFDSVRPETLQLFREKGVKVIETMDQDKTDFHKALIELSNTGNTTFDYLLIICSQTGRLDQLFSVLNSLRAGEALFEGSVAVLMMGCSLTWHLRPGSHTVHVPAWARSHPCGLLPFSPSPSSVSTTGLRWNLDNQSVQFGGLISSSNEFSGEPIVKITTDQSLLWTMCIDDEEELHLNQESKL